MDSSPTLATIALTGELVGADWDGEGPVLAHATRPANSSDLLAQYHFRYQASNKPLPDLEHGG
jgi:hypothetical protein